MGAISATATITLYNWLPSSLSEVDGAAERISLWLGAVRAASRMSAGVGWNFHSSPLSIKDGKSLRLDAVPAPSSEGVVWNLDASSTSSDGSLPHCRAG